MSNDWEDEILYPMNNPKNYPKVVAECDECGCDILDYEYFWLITTSLYVIDA